MHLAEPAQSVSRGIRLVGLALPLVLGWPGIATAAPEPERAREPDAVIDIEGADAPAGEAQDPEPELDEDPAPRIEPSEPAPSIRLRPPRIDGPYFGLLAIGGASFARVLGLDTPNPLLGGGGFLQAGDAVLDWLSLGIAVGGHTGVAGTRLLAAGGLLVEVAFIPSQKLHFTIRTGFGFGGGRIVDRSTGERPGYGGALFKGSLRYEFFPLAAKRRPDRGGGWAIGPELGWMGATPAAKGQPFVHTILLGLSTSIYTGS